MYLRNVLKSDVRLSTVLLSICIVLYMKVCMECEEWPKEKRSEIMFPFFVSDMHSRKVQQRLNEKLWPAENYLRSHGGWRSNGQSHIGQTTHDSSKSIHIDLSLTTSTYSTFPSSSSRYHHVMQSPTTIGHLREKKPCMYCLALRLKLLL